MSLTEFLGLLGGSLSFTALSAGAIWMFGREWVLERLKASIKSEYDHKLAQYQSDLKHASEMQIAQFKSDLEIKAAERNVQYSRVFEETAKAIATTYGLLVHVKRAANIFSRCCNGGVDAAPPDEEARLGKDFQSKLVEFRDYYEQNQLYIPRAT